MILVVAAIIKKQNKYLIAKRSSHKEHGGRWEFPGGKVEDSESYEDSLIRELQEELEMTVEIESLITTSKHDYEQFSIELIAYKCIYKTSNFKLTDHDKYEWVKPNDLLNWKLAPADIPIAEKLIIG